MPYVNFELQAVRSRKPLGFLRLDYERVCPFRPLRNRQHFQAEASCYSEELKTQAAQSFLPSVASQPGAVRAGLFACSSGNSDDPSRGKTNLGQRTERDRKEDLINALVYVFPDGIGLEYRLNNCSIGSNIP